MTDKILVTGGTGFIGTHLVRMLTAEGRSLRVFSRSARRMQDEACVEYVAGNFLEPDDVEAALVDVDVVYHLAVTTTPGTSNDAVMYDAQTNLMASLNLIRAAAEAGVSRFIFVSSGGSVYGPTGRTPIPETHPTDPISAHGVSKLAIEKYLEIYRRSRGLEYRIARGGNPYGEGQDPDKGQGFVAYAMGQLARGGEIVIWGDGSVVRDFFHVHDFASALTYMLDDNAPQRMYNVGSGTGTSLNDIITYLEIVTQQRAQVRYEAGRPADVPYNCLDITRIRTALDWSPQIHLLTGLERAWGWTRAYVQHKDQLAAAALQPLHHSDTSVTNPVRR